MGDFAYITRMAIVTVAPSTVVRQRGTYGLHPERNFEIDERPVMRGAPEQAANRDYLFRKSVV